MWVLLSHERCITKASRDSIVEARVRYLKSREGDGWRVKEARGSRWLREQRFHVAPKSLVASTRLAEKGRRASASRASAS